MISLNSPKSPSNDFKKPNQSDQPFLARKLEIAQLNSNLTDDLKKDKSCINHVEERAVFFDKLNNKHICLNCAVKETLLNKSIPTSSYLTKEEFKKKTGSDEFIQRLKYFQVCLNGYSERNERILLENIHRQRQDVSQINLFFEQISVIFTEVYNKLLGEKSARIEDIKKEHQQKKFYLIENINNVKKFEADIIENYDNIVLGMGINPFVNIMKEYREKVDGIQDFSEEKELDKYSNYEEIRANAGKIEAVNKCVQNCIGLIYEAFDEKVIESPEKIVNNDNRNSLVLNNEMNKINQCFYSNGTTPVPESGKLVFFLNIF